MKKGTLTIWLLTIGVAYYAGTLNHSPPSNGKIDKAEGKSNKPKSTLNSTSSPSSIANNTKHKSLRLSHSSRNRKSMSDVVAELESLVGSSMMGNMLTDEYYESYTLVKDLNEEELSEALSLINLESINHSNMKPLLLLLSKYAEYNPLNAIAFTETNLKTQQLRNSALNSVISKWSKSEPEMAYEWQKEQSLEKADKKDNYSNSFGWYYIFQGLARNDVTSAIEKLKEVSGMGYQDRMAASGLSSAFQEKEDFIAFFEETHDLDNRNAKESVIQNWVRKAPKDAVDWLNTLEKKQRKQYDMQVLNGWMNSSPHEAANWYFESSDDKQKATDTAARQWSWRNPYAALKWVESQEGINTAASVKKVVENSVYQNPDFAARHLDKLTDKKARERLSQKIYANLKRSSETKASEFLESSPYKKYIEKKNTKRQ